MRRYLLNIAWRGAGGPGGIHHLLTHLHDGIVADDSTDDDDAMPMIWMTAHLIAMTLSMDMISVVILLLLVIIYRVICC